MSPPSPHGVRSDRRDRRDRRARRSRPGDGRLASLVAWSRRVTHEPRSELTRWQRAARFAVDLAVVGGQQLRQDRAAQMAAALAFRTLFGLVPTLLVATLLVRALGGFEQFETVVNERLAAMQLDEVGAARSADDADAEGDEGTGDGAAGDEDAGDEAAGEAGTEAADDTLARLIMTLVESVQDINLAAITWVGVIVLAYAAISLVATIETSFNAICRAPGGRPWTRRLPIYWTVLTLAPVLIALVAIVDRRVDLFLEQTLAIGWMLRTAAVVWSLSLTTLLLMAIYKLVPNASVPTKHALAGGFVATVAIEILKRAFAAYVEQATGLQQLTGAIGVVPLFMLWVYVMWLVVLFGLEVAMVLSWRVGRDMEAIRSERMPSVVDPAAVLLVAGAVAARFRDGRSSDVDAVAAATGLPSTAVRPMLERLAEEGVLHRVAGGEDEPFAFARPPEEVDAAELLRIGHELFGAGPGSEPAVTVLARIREAERAAARGVTAAALGRQMAAGGAG